MDLITQALTETMKGPNWIDVAKLSEATVGFTDMWGEDWSAPYEICWQADGSQMLVSMPNVPKFKAKHFEYFAESYGYKHPGQTVLYQYLSIYLITAHPWKLERYLPTKLCHGT